MGRHRTWLVISGVILVSAFVDLLASPLTDEVSDTAVGFSIIAVVSGLVVGQLNLISVWAAMATGALVARLPWALLLTMLMYYTLVLGAMTHDDIKGSEFKFLLGVLLLAQLCAQAPLWIGAKWFGWRLVAKDAEFDAAGTGKQFSILQLMIGTSLLAMVFGLGRIVLPAQALALTRVDLDWEACVILAAMTVFNLQFVVPCVWGAFRPFASMRRLIAIWTVIVTAATIVQFLILCALIGAPDQPLISCWAFLVMNFTQCATVAGTLLLLRSCGFRLIRVGMPNRAESADIPPTT